MMWKPMQRVTSQTEPELGLGTIAKIVDNEFIDVYFASTESSRRYRAKSAPINRFRLQPGQKAFAVSTQANFTIAKVEVKNDLLLYHDRETAYWEDDVTQIDTLGWGPIDSLDKGPYYHPRTFDLRREATRLSAAHANSSSKGLVGPRVQPLPHQLQLAHRVAQRRKPRVLLSDEVGLGKTVEAGLVFSALKAIQKANRVLIVVPPALVNQWVSEMFQKFNQLFSVVDLSRCEAEWQSSGKSAFVNNHFAITSMDFLMKHEAPLVECCEAGWDLVIVDEAHHLEWSPEEPNLHWMVTEQLSHATSGLLLLTATPKKKGNPNQYGLLHLIDPIRFSFYEDFVEDQGTLDLVATFAEKIATKTIQQAELDLLKRLIAGDAELAEKLSQPIHLLDEKAIVDCLVDRHGPGRVLFRNRRAKLGGFPERNVCSFPLSETAETTENLGNLHDATPDELLQHATGSHTTMPLDDERFPWLAEQMFEMAPNEKCVIICRSEQTANDIDCYLRKFTDHLPCTFHQGMAIVDRDKQAARFAQDADAQVLICSEVGGEGRNFQFAQKICLFDLPEHPDVLEQRIGRLDRIGQKNSITIMVPYRKDSLEEVIYRWYHEGFDAFREGYHGFHDVYEK